MFSGANVWSSSSACQRQRRLRGWWTTPYLQRSLTCKVCLFESKTFQDFKSHIRSIKHQQKMNEVFQTESPDWPDSKLPNIAIMDRIIQQNVQQPFLGLHLLTVCYSPGEMSVFYLCHICEEMLLDTQILSHLTSICHKFNYFNYTDPNMLGFSWMPSKDLAINRDRRRMTNLSGEIQMLNLPEKLFALYKTYSYTKVMYSLSEYDKLPKLLEDAERKRVTIQKYHADGQRKYPLLGMQHLIECTCKETERTYYLCTLCKRTLAARTVIKHVLSFDHLYCYFNAWYPCILKSKHCYTRYSHKFVSMMLSLAKEAEKHHGAANMKRLSLEPGVFASVNFSCYSAALNKLEAITKENEGSSLKTCLHPAGQLVPTEAQMAWNQGYSLMPSWKNTNQNPPDTSQNKPPKTLLEVKPGVADEGHIEKASAISVKTEGHNEKPKSCHIPAKATTELTKDVQMIASQGGDRKRLSVIRETDVIDNDMAHKRQRLDSKDAPCEEMLNTATAAMEEEESKMVISEVSEPNRWHEIAHKRQRLDSKENTLCEGTLKMGTVAIKEEERKTLISEVSDPHMGHGAQQRTKQENTLKIEPQEAHLTLCPSRTNVKVESTRSTKVTLLTKTTTSKLPTPALTTNFQKRPTSITQLTVGAHKHRERDSVSVIKSEIANTKSLVPATFSKSIASTTNTAADNTVCAVTSSHFTATTIKSMIVVATAIKPTALTTSCSASTKSRRTTATSSSASAISTTTTLPAACIATASRVAATTTRSTESAGRCGKKSCRVTASTSSATSATSKYTAPTSSRCISAVATTSTAITVKPTVSSVAYDVATSKFSIIPTKSTATNTSVAAVSPKFTPATTKSTAYASANSKHTANATNTKPTSKLAAATNRSTTPTTSCPTKSAKVTATTCNVIATTKSTLPTTSCITTASPAATTPSAMTTTKCATTYNSTVPASTTKSTAHIDSCTPASSSSDSKVPSTVSPSQHQKAPEGRTGAEAISNEALPVLRRSSTDMHEVTGGTAQTARRSLDNSSHTRVTLVTTAVGGKNAKDSAKKVHVKDTRESNADAERCIQKSNPSARHASTAKSSQSKVKPTRSVPKIGLSYIIVVNSNERKQSYCTLCHIRLERSSHTLENVHQYNYVKSRFPEVNDEQLADINLEKFVTFMSMAEKCLGLRSIQTIDVTNEQYNELSDLPEAKALHRLETVFGVPSSSGNGTSLALRQRVLTSPSQDVSSPEYDTLQDKFEAITEADTSQLAAALDIEAEHTSVAVPLADPEPTGETESIVEMDTSEPKQQQEIVNCGFKNTKATPEGSNDQSTSVLMGPDRSPASVTREQWKLEGSNGQSPSVLLGPDPHHASVATEQQNLEAANEQSPSLLLALDQPPASVTREQNLEVYNGKSPSLLMRLDPHPPSVTTKPCNPVGSCQNAERWSSLPIAPIDPECNQGRSASQVHPLSGKSSNLRTFLWVKGLYSPLVKEGLYSPPIVGLASVYECRGGSGDSLYLCNSCSQKLMVRDICQHVVGPDHQVNYMLRAYPQYMDRFWGDINLQPEMKMELLEAVAGAVSLQERAKGMDAQVCFLVPDVYNYVCTAPFNEALDVLQNGQKQSFVCQPVITLQQKQAGQKSKEQIGHLYVNGVDSVEPSFSEASMSLSLQDNHRSSISSPISKTTPVCQVQEELMSSEPTSLGPSRFISKPPLTFKMQDKFGSPGLISKTPPSFQVTEDLVPLESTCPVTVGAISKTPLSFQVKDDLLSECSSGVSTGRSGKKPPICHVKDELRLQQSGPPSTYAPISKTPPGSQQVKEERVLIECRSHVSISKTLPQAQLKSELVLTEPAVNGDPGNLLKTQPHAQVKDEMLLDYRSPATTGPVPKMPSSSRDKDELALLECKSPANTVLFSKTPPRVQMKSELTASACRVTPLVEKQSSSDPPITVGSTIRQDEYLPTKKRKTLKSLGELIRIYSNTNRIDDPQQSKCTRNSIVNPSDDRTPSDQEVSMVEILNLGTKTDSKKQIAAVPAKLSVAPTKTWCSKSVQSVSSSAEDRRGLDSMSCKIESDLSPTPVSGNNGSPQVHTFIPENPLFILTEDKSTGTDNPNDSALLGGFQHKNLLDDVKPNQNLAQLPQPQGSKGGTEGFLHQSTVWANDMGTESNHQLIAVAAGPTSTGTDNPGDLALLGDFENKNLLGNASVKTNQNLAQLPQPQGSTDGTGGFLHQSIVWANGMGAESNHQLIGATAGPTKTQLPDLGGFDFSCTTNAYIAPTGYPVPDNNNVSTGYPVPNYNASYVSVNGNEGSRGLYAVQGSHLNDPLATRWMNLQIQQWMQQQQQYSTWARPVQTTQNVTNGATYFCAVPAVYSNYSLVLRDMNVHGNLGSSQYNFLTMAQSSKKD
ncbi:uncharacterized protein LOC129172948 isoform X3 [Dunckerocampus dactyliophorus]|uniref:uncharacterized protein LOC129172948 isoform X3 n=1 Tax=Dunckerocampus dactyliophorus TaxID=161453 RepID=UPI002405FA62|nr:uncharacterized protein LOC129172948 isoform X3 [Dunckerocampus dactyliophorus]